MCNSNFARHDFLLNHNKTKNMLIGNEKQYYQIQIVHWDYLLKNYRSEFISIMYPSLKQTIYMTIETCWLICICNIAFSIETISKSSKENIIFTVWYLPLQSEINATLSITFIIFNCIRDTPTIQILSRLSCSFKQCFL